MPKSIIAVLAFFIWSVSAFAQEINIQCRVVNDEDSLPVPYATLGVESKSYGTVANEDGYAILKLDNGSDIKASDSVVFSCVGFNPQKIAIGKIPKTFFTIYLSSRVTVMNEVIVKPKSDCKMVELGKANHVGLGGYNFYSSREKHFNDKLGREFGIVLNLDEDKIYSVNNLNVFAVSNEFKKVLFRICVYKVVDGKIASDNLLNRDIQWEVSENTGWKKIDLSPYHIILHDLDEIAVTLQWIKSEPLNKASRFFSVKGAISPVKNAVARDKSNSQWGYGDGTPSIFLSVKRCSK